MANCVAEGANGTIVPCGEMNAAKLAEFDAVAFGCPAMGAEQLEESEFEPMFSDLEGSLNGKKIALFGSYGWGDGQWMRDWVERAQGDGAQVLNGEMRDTGFMTIRHWKHYNRFCFFVSLIFR